MRCISWIPQRISNLQSPIFVGAGEPVVIGAGAPVVISLFIGGNPIRDFLGLIFVTFAIFVLV